MIAAETGGVGDAGHVRERGFADLLCRAPSTIARCRALRCSCSSPLRLPAAVRCSTGAVSLARSSSSCLPLTCEKFFGGFP